MSVMVKKSTPVNKVRVSLSISPSLLTRVDQIAEETETTRSAVIQAAVRAYLLGK